MDSLVELCIWKTECQIYRTLEEIRLLQPHLNSHPNKISANKWKVVCHWLALTSALFTRTHPKLQDRCVTQPCGVHKQAPSTCTLNSNLATWLGSDLCGLAHALLITSEQRTSGCWLSLGLRPVGIVKVQLTQISVFRWHTCYPFVIQYTYECV